MLLVKLGLMELLRFEKILFPKFFKKLKSPLFPESFLMSSLLCWRASCYYNSLYIYFNKDVKNKHKMALHVSVCVYIYM